MIDYKTSHGRKSPSIFQGTVTCLWPAWVPSQTATGVQLAGYYHSGGLRRVWSRARWVGYLRIRAVCTSTSLLFPPPLKTFAKFKPLAIFTLESSIFIQRTFCSVGLRHTGKSVFRVRNICIWLQISGYDQKNEARSEFLSEPYFSGYKDFF
jgi:hypothetical protein